MQLRDGRSWITGITVIPMETLTFKVTEDEARAIRAKARLEKVTVSEFLRQRALDRPAQKTKARFMRCSKTGAMIFAALRDEVPLTTDSVRQYLAEFPQYLLDVEHSYRMGFPLELLMGSIRFSPKGLKDSFRTF